MPVASRCSSSAPYRARVFNKLLQQIFSSFYCCRHDHTLPLCPPYISNDKAFNKDNNTRNIFQKFCPQLNGLQFFTSIVITTLIQLLTSYLLFVIQNFLSRKFPSLLFRASCRYHLIGDTEDTYLIT